jgi:hypothetical protein
LPSGFTDKILFGFLIFPMRAVCPFHLIILYYIIVIIYGEEYKLRSSSLYSFFQPPVTLPLLGPNILPQQPFSITLNLRSSLNAKDQISHQDATTGWPACSFV